MRFFYFYPNYSAPSGGNKQLRLQGTVLSEMGHEVFLVRDTKYFSNPEEFEDQHIYNVSLPLWPTSLPKALGEFREDDVLILPEGNLDRILPDCVSTRAKIVINNQNGFYALRYFPTNRQTCRRIDAVISNSPYNCTVSRVAYHVPASKVFYVPHWVLRGNFEIPTESNDAKQVAICYMPRKLPELVGRVKEGIQSRFPDIPWVEIDRVPETVVAQRLRDHTMFFAAQHLEGCPLTALEAMACGCLVAGFPGTEGFSHPYASASNGYWANDNDAPSAIRAVASMIEDSRDRPAKIKSILENGLRTAQVYSKKRVLMGLERFVEGLSGRSSSGVEMHRSMPSRIPEERWNWSDFLFAQRKMHHYNRLTGLTGRFLKTLERLRSSH
jgi:hypothetical protein